MKKSYYLLILTTLLLTGCGSNNSSTTSESSFSLSMKEDKDKKYGAFLGINGDEISKLYNYDIVSIDAFEFSDKELRTLKEKNIEVISYLNIGSLEEYREYYYDFKKYTFMDYDNWPDERWIDIRETSWQSFLVDNLGKTLKNRGISYIYLDNLDIYDIGIEYFGSSTRNDFYDACKNVILKLENVGLNVIVNSGTTFLEDASETKDGFLANHIYGYHQESVFSTILDYEKNIFGKQSKEDTDYYLEISSMMKTYGKKVFFLEYTKDEELKKTIDSYCSEHEYYYYCANDIALN